MSASTSLKIALGVSLALNLVVAGFFLGAAFNTFRATEENKQTVAPGPTVWALSEKLNPQDRAALKAVLQEQGELLAPTLADVRRARREAIIKMSAPQYDAAAVDADLARTRAGEIKARSQVDQALLALMPKLNQPDRELIADAVVRGRIGRANEGQSPANR